jgi:hypothetical protein
VGSGSSRMPSASETVMTINHSDESSGPRSGVREDESVHDGRALTEKEMEDIQRNVYAGLFYPDEINRLFETIVVQKRVLKEMLGMFKQETPLRRVSVADPIRNSQLAHFKELVAMEDPVNPGWR